MAKLVGVDYLKAISKTLADAIELSCTCSIAPKGDGYLKHAKSCGVHFNRTHFRRTARFLAQEFKERDMRLYEQQWAEAANSLVQPQHEITIPCPNCKETQQSCKCLRNECLRCGGPVGNITFTVCDDCWNLKSSVEDSTA